MRSIRAIHASRVASRIITSSDANGERRKKRKAESKERTVYTNGISISKKERETMIHITIELYTYQGTIPVIFLSLFATFASIEKLFSRWIDICGVKWSSKRKKRDSSDGWLPVRVRDVRDSHCNLRILEYSSLPRETYSRTRNDLHTYIHTYGLRRCVEEKTGHNWRSRRRVPLDRCKPFEESRLFSAYSVILCLRSTA